MTKLTLEEVRKAVESAAAAFRCRRRLQPAGGPGSKVFPPTFAGGVYAIEKRRIPGFETPVTCVLLDSVQSQANWMELALQEAVDAGRIRLPLVVVDFSEHDPIGDPEEDEKKGKLIEKVGRITTLQAPHRIADAIFRDSELNGVKFRKSPVGRELNKVSLANATPLFTLCPTALVFGEWDSTGPKGGLGPKFERAIVSEIVGVGAEIGDLRRGVRRDPLEISKNVRVVQDKDKSLLRVAEGKEQGAVRPSEINHSSVPFPEQRERKTENNYYDGVTIEYAEQTTTLSLICLRRLRFPLNGKTDPKVDVAARTVLAALGLAAATLAFEAGMDLRSRCLLWPDGSMVWELLDRPGEEPKKYTLTSDGAVKLLEEAVKAAVKTPEDAADEDAKFQWPDKPLELKPSKQLVELVRLSQLEAAKEPAPAS